MRRQEVIKFFILNSLSIESHIRQIERDFKIDFGHTRSEEEPVYRDYYSQFAEQFRKEAKKMSINYTIFYCLENSIREIITKRLKEKFGPNWWDKKVPDAVKDNATNNKKKEIESGITPRSTELIDFTNFGELGSIIKENWDDTFSDMFRDKHAVGRILATLNNLRAPIAHCKALAEDEEKRLLLSLSDWFRQME